MSSPDADTQDDSHAAKTGTPAKHFQNLVLVGGHRIHGRVYSFPHLCPGPDCAIGNWMTAKHNRGEYESQHPIRREWTPYREQDA